MIYVDLDGVLADFFGEVKRLGLDYHADPKSAWAVIDRITNFFYFLKPFDGAHYFMQEVRKMATANGTSVAILTAMPQPTGLLEDQAAKDKQKWVRDHIGDMATFVVPNWSHKKDYIRYSGKYDILIDDSFRNIYDWGENGGLGVLHRGDYTETLKILDLYLRM